MSPTRSICPKVCFVIAVGLVILLAASRVWLIPAHFSSDPNEGWNAFQAVHALGADPLYPPAQALTGNNYPPLSFYLVGAVGLLFGDPIVGGRILALISVLVVAGGIFATARRFAGPDAAAVGALLFLGFNVTLFRPYLCMDDPQWLAHALMSAGLAALIPVRPDGSPTATGVIAAALLMLLGGMVKHNLVAFPAATALWLALHHRRSLSIWIGTATAALLVAAALCYRAYGTDFFVDLLLADRHYSVARMIVKSAPVVIATAPLLVVSAGLVRERKSDRRVDLLLLAIAIGVPLGIIQRSGQGVDRNAHFEALIALCMAGAVALDRSRLTSGKAWLARPFPWLILPFLVLVPLAFNAEAKEIGGRALTERSWRRMEDRIAAIPGRVACEAQALCYWAGKKFEIDFFLYGQRIARQHNSASLQRALDEHRFGAIEMDPPKDPEGRLGEVDNPIRDILNRQFQTVFVGDDGRRLLEPAP